MIVPVKSWFKKKCPYTAGTFFALGKKRGELNILWSTGEPERSCPHVQLQPSQESDEDE